MGEAYGSSHINLTHYTEENKISAKHVDSLVAYSLLLDTQSEERLDARQKKEAAKLISLYHRKVGDLNKAFEAVVREEWEGDQEEIEYAIEELGWYSDAQFIVLKDTGEVLGLFVEYYLSEVDGYTSEVKAIAYEIKGDKLTAVTVQDPN